MNDILLSGLKACERVRLECIMMLCIDRELSLYHFQSMFRVSRNTILNDLNAARKYAGEYNAAIEYTRQDGYTLTGGGDDIRALMYDCVNTVGNSKRFINLIDTMISEVDSQDLYNRVCNAVWQALSTRSVWWKRILVNRSSCMMILLWLYSRTRYYVPPEKANQLCLSHKLEALTGELLEDLPFKIRPEETKYIAILALNIARDPQLVDEVIDRDITVFETYAEETVDRFSLMMRAHDYDRWAQIVKITGELQGIYFEHFYRLQLGNSMLMDFKKYSGDLFSIVKLILRDVKDTLGFEPSVDEICSLAISFISVLDASERPVWISEVLFYTPDEKKESTYYNLVELFPEFKFRWIKSREELLRQNANSYCIIMTDQDIVIPWRKPIYKLTCDEDVAGELELRGKILDLLYGGGMTPDPKQNYSASKIVKLLEVYCDVRDETSLNYVFGNLPVSVRRSLVEAFRLPGLKDVLSEQSMVFEECCASWEDAIRVASAPLIRQGCVREGYVDEMIQSIYKHGPYAAVYPGFALPHAWSRGNVKRIGFSFLHLNRPVCLPGARHNNIYVIIVIATVNDKLHKKALGELAEILEAREIREALLACTTTADVVKLLYGS